MYNVQKGVNVVGSQAWNSKNSVLVALRFTKNSGIPQALGEMSKKTGLKDTEYIRQVVTESLRRDGYLRESKTEK